MDTTIGLRILLCSAALAFGQTSDLPVPGYAKTSVNAVVFRGNSVVTFGQTQYVAYYDSVGKVVLGKRTLGTTSWQTKTTAYSGTVSDAHNSISIMVDGDGFLHMAWDMHATKLRYCRATAPASLEMGPETAMTGAQETLVTYPQFFRLADGNLLFLYRSGSSGSGDLIIDRYDLKSKSWKRLQDKLVDGEGARNAYWQAHMDRNGVLHLGWVWRETSDVATNHDLCYARSRDGGVTWEKSTGAKYALPITAATAEYALKIAQKSDLINQTSIYGDERSRPYIATYWAPAGTGIPQYHLVYNDGSAWKSLQISQRTTAFSLAGVGTKKIPISRPQLVVDGSTDSVAAWMVFRDVERGDKVSLVQTANLAKGVWATSDLTTTAVDSWEPSFDTERWNASHILDLFVQRVGQGDGETSVNLAPQTVRILEWTRPGVGVGEWTRLDRSVAGRGSFDMLGRPRDPETGATGVYGTRDSRTGSQTDLLLSGQAPSQD